MIRTVLLLQIEKAEHQDAPVLALVNGKHPKPNIQVFGRCKWKVEDAAGLPEVQAGGYRLGAVNESAGDPD